GRTAAEILALKRFAGCARRNLFSRLGRPGLLVFRFAHSFAPFLARIDNSYTLAVQSGCREAGCAERDVDSWTTRAEPMVGIRIASVSMNGLDRVLPSE